ncbi:MAG: methyltransferase [Anaerolineales bacterium]|jgi:protein-S-isoprenylcysteine O-methyltransferase Ste14
MESTEMRQKIVKRIVQVVVTTLIQGVLLFLAAGDLGWVWGWLYIGTYLVGILINAVMLFQANPAVIAERADTQGVRGWDMLWGSLAAAVVMIGLPVAGGLDFRFGWSAQMSQVLHLVGAAVFMIGGIFFAWAMAVNAKFATIVRVGDESSHPVAMDGPYRIVRHPGYLGFCFQTLGLPLLLGTWWGYVLSVLGIVFIIIRTALEDKTLQAELPGYEKLVQQTRYRLLPGIW